MRFITKLIKYYTYIILIYCTCNCRFDDEECIKTDPEVSNSLKVVVAGGGSVVKTFKAETIEHEVSSKKLSGDFKPIPKEALLDRESEGLEGSVPSKGISGIDLNKDDDSPPSERISSSLPSSKRKRRKRSILKKKNNGNQRRNSNIEQSDVNASSKKEQGECDPIFQIEDLDQVCIYQIK